MTYQEHFEQSCELRDNFWKSKGELDPDVIAHMINPAFMGGPAWPSLRQAFITLRRPEATILASDGLSDPYDDMDENDANAEYNGFGLEVYVESAPIEGPVQHTWQFNLVWQAAQLMAQQGSVISLLEEMTYITTEFYDVDVPAHFKTDNGTVGAILGLPNTTFEDSVQLSLEKVRMVNVKLLTLDELNYVIANGAQGRMELAEKLIAQGNATLSSIGRPSVV
jgi:hypothetical protein